jgi:hypothetical protein
MRVSRLDDLDRRDLALGCKEIDQAPPHFLAHSGLAGRRG